MKLFDRTVLWLLRAALLCFGRRKRDRVLASIASSLAPAIRIPPSNSDSEIKVICNSKQALYWAKNFHTHEPETLEWIRSFQPGDVFWDIGANVGIYALFAASREGVQVLAFEPMTESFSSLQKNIYLNRKTDVIQGFCIAFSDTKSISRLVLSNISAGSDSHTFIRDGDKAKTGGNNQSQYVLSMSIDDFVKEFRPAFPSHIKIDVDGPELEILSGAAETLRDVRLKTVLIEGDTEGGDRNKQIFSILEEAGFHNISRGATAGGAKHCNFLFGREA